MRGICRGREERREVEGEASSRRRVIRGEAEKVSGRRCCDREKV